MLKTVIETDVVDLDALERRYNVPSIYDGLNYGQQSSIRRVLVKRLVEHVESLPEQTRDAMVKSLKDYTKYYDVVVPEQNLTKHLEVISLISLVPLVRRSGVDVQFMLSVKVSE